MSFWRNWLQKLAQYLNNSPAENEQISINPAPDTANSDTSTRAEDLAFLQEAVKLTAESNVNPSVVYPFLATRTAQLNINLIAAIQDFATDSTITDLFSFASLIQQFPLGQRDANLEISIAIYSIALDFFERDTKPTAWATIQNSLAVAYNYRIRGERVQNLEKAIACFQESLQVRTRDAFPEDWAMTQNNLGNAYNYRIRGERVQNLEKAIACYQDSLQVYTRDAFPKMWARSQNNLGVAYKDRIRGERAQNLEKAIACYRDALQVRTRHAFPEDWAMTQNNLGNAYRNRIRGERAQNIEDAIACYQDSLQVYTRDAFPEDWAKSQNNLGNAYRNRIRGERAQNIEDAIACYQDSLQMYTREAFPEMWATTQNNLGLAYNDRIRGERVQNLEKAIACYQDSLQVYTRDAFPEMWANTQNNLGIVYNNRIRGERAQNIEDAIACYQDSLQVYTRDAFPYQWATTQNNLGLAYNNHIRGERARNIEDAIACYRDALQVRTRDAFPEQWAMTQNNLGNAYGTRIRGERAQNIEDAIACYQDSLQVYTRDAFPEMWATTQNNLGLAYNDRIRGEWTQNIEDAIACLLASLQVYTRDAFPEDWARSQSNLGIAYSKRIRGKRTQDIEEAITCYQDSLQVYTRDAFPEMWATIQNNLGIAYENRIRGRRAKNIEDAIACYQDSLQVYTRDAFPEMWAMTQNNLGIAYRKRIRGKRARNIDRAIACYQDALQVYTPETLPLDCLRTGRNLGNLGFAQQNWEIAIEGYNQAILAIEQSRYWATSEATKRELIANSLDIYQKMVQACINHQDYAQALLTVERSKSRTLIELLDSATLYPKNATDQQKQRISDLRRQIAIYQQQLAYTPSDTLTPTREKHPNQPSPETLIRQQLQAANQQFQDLLAELDDPNFTLTQQVPPQLPDLRRLLQPQTALIEWYLPSEADSGFYLFLVTRRDEQIQITPHHFSAEDRQHLDQALQDYRSDYRQNTLNQQLPQRLETLSSALQFPRILAELSQIQQLILIPHRELHLIPLHALPVSLPSPSGSEGQCLQDWFPVQYAPSCQILNNLQQRPPLQEPSTSFFALKNPTQDLTYADFEVEVLRRLFNPERVLSHDEATKTALEQPENRAFLQQSRYIHFSCHGEFKEADPLNAYLRLANQEKLTFQDIFTSLDIPNCRLLILSACKTGLVETRPTDDYVGLASAFFFAGTRTVVGSLWEAEQFSAALLMIRLYYELPRHTSVVMALRAAQDWLRTISRDGVLTWLRDELKLDEVEIEICQDELLLFDSERPFALARYWAAFTANGQ